MASSLNYDFDNMQVAIDSLKKISLDLHNTLNNIYKLQEDFKKYKGGTYFETKFVTKKILDTYAIELDANLDWVKKYHEGLKEANSYIEKEEKNLSQSIDKIVVHSGVADEKNKSQNPSLAEIPKAKKVNTDSLNSIDLSNNETKNDSVVVTPISTIASATKSTKQEDIVDETSKNDASKDAISVTTIDTKSVEQGDIVDESKKVDTSGTSLESIDFNVTPESLISVASDIKDKQVKGGWRYSKSNLPLDIRDAENNKNSCCATYVSTVLYESGAFTADEINTNVASKSHNHMKWGFNHPEQIAALCENAGWTKINSYSDIKPGDIVFYEGKHKENGVFVKDLGHVEICSDQKYVNGVPLFYGVGNAGSFSKTGPGFGSIDVLPFAIAYRMPSN